MKLASWIMLAIILTIVAIPFVTHNQIYQTLLTAPDGLVHTKVIQDYMDGVPPHKLYPAQEIFGKVLANIARLNHVSAQWVFQWFMATSLGIALWITYYVVMELAGIQAGYFAVLLGLFRINSLLMEFTYAVAFNLIDMYIILPLCILFIVKWLVNQRKRDLVFGLIFMAIFSALHVVAIYVPYIVATLLAGVVVYKLVTHKSIKKFVFAGLLVTAVNLAVSLPLMGQIGYLTKVMLETMWHGGMFVTNLGYLIMVDVTPLVLVAGIISVIILKKVTLTEPQKYLLAIFGVMACILIVAGMVGSVEWHARQIIDGSILLSLFVSVVIGAVWQTKKLSWLIMPTMAVTGLNVINTGIAWIK